MACQGVSLFCKRGVPSIFHRIVCPASMHCTLEAGNTNGGLKQICLASIESAMQNFFGLHVDTMISSCVQVSFVVTECPSLAANLLADLLTFASYPCLSKNWSHLPCKSFAILDQRLPMLWCTWMFGIFFFYFLYVWFLFAKYGRHQLYQPRILMQAEILVCRSADAVGICDNKCSHTTNLQEMLAIFELTA